MSGLLPNLIRRLSRWWRRIMPTREELEGVPMVRPLARRQELWRFTRRSVPRGVAVGLLVGIFALVPGVQIVGAALMCVPVRGNIPLAAAMTFLSNPATTPFILAAAIMIGNRLGFHADMATLNGLYADGASWRDWGYWLVSDAAPALLLGLFLAWLHPILPVYRKPRVALLATGDELVLPGRQPGPGQIVYSNGYSVATLAREEGAEVSDLGIARDNVADTVAAI
ncbi:MAG TPA: DUF2062 domain-containing protein, partial [Novosphingobium sp.]|nr:DUF2062 domain-containing protein [Novosphingobium sp.]